MTTLTLNNLQQRFTALSPKDRLALTVLGVFLSLLIVIYLLILPANRFAIDAAQHHQQRAELLAWMRANETPARMLTSQNSDQPSQSQGQSILSLASQSAQTHNISFKRFEPFDENGLRVWLDNIAFNDMLMWLTQMQDQYGVQVHQANVDRGKSSGMITAKLELILPL